jgi:hypothetical protein
MNVQIEIKMYYYNLSTLLTSSVTKLCEADLSNITLLSENIARGRRQDSITGELTVDKEYNDFATFLNDKANYFVDPGSYNTRSGWTYRLWRNGVELTTNKIRLIFNDIDTGILKFNLFGEINSEYTNIYADIDNEYNIINDVSPIGNTVTYADFRSSNTSAPVVQPGIAPTSQQDLDTYINEKVAEFENKIPILITYLGVGAPWIPSITYQHLEAIGYKNGTTNEPPAGVNWIYNADVGGQPQFYKKPTLIDIEYSTYIIGGSINNTTINVEQEADIDYSGVSRRLDDIIEYLIGQADASIVFDANSFDGFDDIVGEGNFNGSDKFFADAVLIGVSDMVPTLAGNQKTNVASRGYISFAEIDKLLSQLGWYWYLEESGGSFKFRMNHITLKSLGSSNPSLINYFGKDYTYRKQKNEILDAIFDIINNATISSDYNFRRPNFEYKTGTKKEIIESSRIITDVNYVIDAKESVFDLTSGEQWVLLSTTFDGVSTYDIRQFTSNLNSVLTNNYELSFHWMVFNIVEMPGKVSKENNVFDDSKIQKRNMITIKIPIDDFFNDFNFYDDIPFYGNDGEIQSMSMKIKDTTTEFKFIYL